MINAVVIAVILMIVLCLCRLNVVISPRLNRGGSWKLENLSAEEESGIPCVAVKCAEIWRNTSGEGDFLVCN